MRNWLHPHGALRQGLGLVVLFACLGLPYLLFDEFVAVAVMIGMGSMWLIIGIGTGYWHAIDAITERMLPEMIRWRKINDRRLKDDLAE